MSARTIRFLSSKEVIAALPMEAAVKAMKRAFILLSAGEAVVPPRVSIETARKDGSMLFMPSYLPCENSMGVKLLSLFPGNAARGLPYIQSLMVLYDGNTGSPLAVMDGGSLTAIRTGAAAGAATAALAREESSSVAIFGAGVQGRTQLEAVCVARRILRAIIYDPDRAAAQRFAAEMSAKTGIGVAVAATPAEALREADIVCTVTVSREPVFRDHELKRGAHVNAMGSFKLDAREIPGGTVARSRIFVDHRESALSEAGDLVIPMNEALVGGAEAWTELGETLAGKKPGRLSEDEVTLFKSVGLGIQDLVAAAAVLECAEREGLGTLLEWG